MRRTHLRGHDNILKRVLVHSGAFNLGLLMRQSLGVGTPRGLQGRLRALLSLLAGAWQRLTALSRPFARPIHLHNTPSPLGSITLRGPAEAALATDC